MNSRQRRVKRRRLERSYEAYLDACAAYCRCCSCSGLCAGVTAGGMCDRICFCGRDEDDGEADEYGPYDGDYFDERDDGTEPFVSTCPGGFGL